MTRPTATYLPAAERRLATIEAVVELAGLGNPSEITTSAIAQHMGLTQGSVFKHFAARDAIVLAVMEWIAEKLLARVDKAVQGAASPLRALEAVFMSHVEFVAKHPGVPRLVFGELQRPGQSPSRRVVQTLQQRYRERVAAVLTDAIASGELDPAIDVEAAAVLFIGSVQGLVMQSLTKGDLKTIRKDAPRVFAIYRRGIERAQ